MTSHPTPRELRTIRAAKPGRRGARLAASLALAAIAFGASTCTSPPAAAGNRCGSRPEILKHLQQRHEETPQALGLSADGGVLEVLVSPEGGWTILVTYPKRPTCIVAIGEAWEQLQLTGGQGA
jgi:hypothetical protein